MTDLIATTTLRNNLSNTLDTIEDKKPNYLLVSRKGKISAALVNLDLFEDLLALSSDKLAKNIKQARQQIKNGEYSSHEDLFGKL